MRVCRLLQVSSELEVWQAITDWVGAAPAGRRPLLYELLRAGVRLGAMDTLQLDAVQRHPLLQVGGQVDGRREGGGGRVGGSVHDVI